MLELKGIKKDYPAGDGIVHALKGIDLQFRENEFVSILGQSGCGKTTMLNIIGGLDQYTEGDLVINGTSTKDFKDRDWDAYRNHSIGFVFQSYNLIPHQTVLQNVELALTLSGVSKAERRERAKKALAEVGLENQLYKKPSQMSGGQMQRVAIARALVNNPDIILADEPTGALDTETSIQVMEILKSISKDHLIIMVTHNPELAEKYSTRIIRMLDGVITDDSSPLSKEEYEGMAKADEQKKAAKKKKEKKPSMSYGTSFGLSMKNLFTKKGRTILTAFAGSIGIIGIALIFSVSKGMTTYIDEVQETTLASYPLTIESTNIDVATLLSTFMGVGESSGEHEKDAVYQKQIIYDMLNAVNNLEASENDLRSFKEYIEESRADEENPLHNAISGVQYTYNTNMQVYTKNVDGDVICSDSQALMEKLITQMMGADAASYMMQDPEEMYSGTPMSSLSSMFSGNQITLWQEMLPGENGKLVSPMLEKQYDVIYGSWPTEYNEVVLVVDENNELDDMTLYALGLESQENVDIILDAAENRTEIDEEVTSWSYEDICAREYRTVFSADCYTYDEASGTYTDLRETDAGLKYLYDNGTVLKVSGIIRPKEDETSTIMTGAIGYTSKLTEYIIEESKDSAAIQAQLESPDKDIFTGLSFEEDAKSLDDEEKAERFVTEVENMTDAQKAEIYIQIMSIPSEEQIQAAVDQSMEDMSIDDMKVNMIQGLSEQMGMEESKIEEYIESMSDDDFMDMFTQMVEQSMRTQMEEQTRAGLASYTTEQLVQMLDMGMDTYTVENKAQYFDELLEFSTATCESNLSKLGYIDIEEPSAVNLYTSTFEDKDVIEDMIAEYNSDKEELEQISYTDYVGLMMSSITTIINAITYVLISFVAISLVVSSIMIGVITLISVQERTKEIGILRAIGASKKDVSSLFNAETLIIGFASGLLGVIVTYLLCIPINAIIHALTGINKINAYLPLSVAVVLVLISMLLTLIAGVIPSRSASKKDPVIALRTE